MSSVRKSVVPRAPPAVTWMKSSSGAWTTRVVSPTRSVSPAARTQETSTASSFTNVPSRGPRLVMTRSPSVVRPMLRWRAASAESPPRAPNPGSSRPSTRSCGTRSSRPVALPDVTRNFSPATSPAYAESVAPAGQIFRFASVAAVDVEQAVRSRRTHKAYGSEPVDRATLDELFELARWAPNHNLTNPWRFRVLGPEALARLKEAAGPEAAAKLDRAPTLVAASVLRSGDPVQDEEDLCAAAAAAYIVLLSAHGRGLAGYWRTPEVLRSPEGRAALGIGEDEHVLGLLHLGPPRQEREAPERLSPGDYVSFLP